MNENCDLQKKRGKSYIKPNLVNELTRKTLVLILAGGEGSRLQSLTDWRAKPAVPFGGKYRIIDFTLSNCINSGLRRIGVLTQYKSHSLIRHLQRAWGFMRNEIDEFVEILPAQQRTSKKHWYQGTADALYQNIDIIQRHQSDTVIVLGGDHIYSMDYSDMLLHHMINKADFTVGCIEIPIEKAKDFGVMSINEDMSINKFTEKPSKPEAIPGHPDLALVSMGIYIFSTQSLCKLLRDDAENKDSSHDFGKDIVPRNIDQCHAIAYRFRDHNDKPGYWRDVGSIDSYWEANMDLCAIDPELNLYDRDWPIWTYQTQHPPAKFIFDEDSRRGEAIDSLISAGCILSGALVKRSIIFFATRIGNYSNVKDSVVLPKVTIGDNCHITKAIIDKGCHIEDGTIIGKDLEQDKKRFYVTDSGIVLVTMEMLGQDMYTAKDPLAD